MAKARKVSKHGTMYNAPGTARRVKEILAEVCKPGHDAEFAITAYLLLASFLLHEANTGSGSAATRKGLMTLIDNINQDSLYEIQGADLVKSTILLLKQRIVLGTFQLRGIVRIAKREAEIHAKRQADGSIKFGTTD